MRPNAPPVFLTLFAAAALAMSPAIAAAPEPGLEVGASVDRQMTVTDSSGAKRTLQSLMGPKGVVVYFVRSLDWCPYCRAQAIGVDAARQEFASRGLSVAIASYDAADRQAAFAAGRNIHLTLLSDPQSAMIDAFGIRNKAHTEGKFAGIPYPSAFVIRPDATIAAKLYELDYAVTEGGDHLRPEVAAVLDAIDRSR